MITVKEKNDIYRQILPFGLYYESKTHISNINKKLFALKEDAFETIKDFKTAVKSILHSNNLTFVAQSKGLSEIDFINALNKQYEIYNLKAPQNIFKWLNFTFNLIVNGKGLHFQRVDNIDLINTFEKWHEAKLKPIKGELTNWTYVQRYYSTYLENVNFNIDNLDKIRELSDNLFQNQIYDICHRATIEIKHLSISNTFNLKPINNELNLLINRINELIHEHKLNHVDNMPNYICFFDTVQYLFNLCDWFNSNIESEIIKKTRIAVKLNGCGAENLNVKTHPVFYYIKDVLNYYKLSPFEAIDILNDTRGTFSPNFNILVTNNIISYLETLNNVNKELNEPQQGAKESENLEYNTRIFTSLKGFIVFDKLVKTCPKVSDTYSFIYLQLVKDGYIFTGIKQREIKDFFNSEPYKITIDKIKTLNVLQNEQRMALYSSVLDSNK